MKIMEEGQSYSCSSVLELQEGIPILFQRKVGPLHSAKCIPNLHIFTVLPKQRPEASSAFLDVRLFNNRLIKCYIIGSSRLCFSYGHNH